MQKLIGEMDTAPDAMEWMEDWYKDRRIHAPSHPMLTHYCKRRHASLMKMAMIHSIARNNDLLIELEDFESAWATLSAAEEGMPEIFKEMTSSPDKRVIEEIHRWCFRYLIANKTDCVPRSKGDELHPGQGRRSPSQVLSEFPNRLGTASSEGRSHSRRQDVHSSRSLRPTPTTVSTR
jgi:hypothetical protein